MTDRTRVRLAWVLCAVTLTLAAVQTTILVIAETPLISGEFSDDGFPVVTLAAVVASVVGVLIVSRHPRHRIGWLFLIGQVATMAGLSLQSYGFVALTDGLGPGQPAQVAVWLSVMAGGILALGLMALLLLLVPDGRLLSPRWRWTVWVTVLGYLVHVLAVLTISPSSLDAEGQVSGDAGEQGILALIGAIGVTTGLVAGAVSLVVRMRRARGDERAQLLWVGSAAFALAVSVPLGITLDMALGIPTWVTSLPLMLAYLAVPVVTGVAILRYRLYDIDVLLNRSIVLTVLTVLVGGAYVVLVVALGGLVDPGDGDYGWTSLLATVVVALGVQPLRRRVERFADRLVYGAQAVPYEALATFSRELRVGVPASAMLPGLAETCGRMLGARRVLVAVGDGPDAERDVGEWVGPPGDDDAGTAFTVKDQGQDLGVLTVFMARGRGLRPAERQLLEDLAAQLGPAFRTLRLQAQLAAQVELLTASGEALARSRRRLLDAEASERARFESAIRREVLPHIERAPTTLRSLADDVGRGAAWPRRGVDEVIAGVNGALEALRTLTRGVFPAVLERRGLVAALETHVARTGHRLDVAEEHRDRRLPRELESVGYFCAVEALRALRGPGRVSVGGTEVAVVVTVAGEIRPSFEADTDHLVDRTEAVGGTLIRERRGSRASVTVVLPLPSGPLAEPDGPELVGAEG